MNTAINSKLRLLKQGCQCNANFHFITPGYSSHSPFIFFGKYSKITNDRAESIIFPSKAKKLTIFAKQLYYSSLYFISPNVVRPGSPRLKLCRRCDFTQFRHLLKKSDSSCKSLVTGTTSKVRSIWAPRRLSRVATPLLFVRRRSLTPF